MAEPEASPRKPLDRMYAALVAVQRPLRRFLALARFWLRRAARRPARAFGRARSKGGGARGDDRVSPDELKGTVTPSGTATDRVSLDEFVLTLKSLSPDAAALLIVGAMAVAVAAVVVVAAPHSIERMRATRAHEAALAGRDARVAELTDARRRLARFEAGFQKWFTTEEIFKLTAQRAAEFEPDGLDERGDLVRSLLWQLKAHRGSAHFLAGSRALTLEVRFLGDRFDYRWRRAASRVPELLSKLGVNPTQRALKAINSQINRLGFTTIVGRGVIARGFDGKLQIVKNK